MVQNLFDRLVQPVAAILEVRGGILHQGLHPRRHQFHVSALAESGAHLVLRRATSSSVIEGHAGEVFQEIEKSFLAVLLLFEYGLPASLRLANGLFRGFVGCFRSGDAARSASVDATQQLVDLGISHHDFVDRKRRLLVVANAMNRAPVLLDVVPHMVQPVEHVGRFRRPLRFVTRRRRERDADQKLTVRTCLKLLHGIADQLPPPFLPFLDTTRTKIRGRPQPVANRLCRLPLFQQQVAHHVPLRLNRNDPIVFPIVRVATIDVVGVLRMPVVVELAAAQPPHVVGHWIKVHVDEHRTVLEDVASQGGQQHTDAFVVQQPRPRGVIHGQEIEFAFKGTVRRSLAVRAGFRAGNSTIARRIGYPQALQQRNVATEHPALQRQLHRLIDQTVDTLAVVPFRGEPTQPDQFVDHTPQIVTGRRVWYAVRADVVHAEKPAPYRPRVVARSGVVSTVGARLDQDLFRPVDLSLQGTGVGWQRPHDQQHEQHRQEPTRPGSTHAPAFLQATHHHPPSPRIHGPSPGATPAEILYSPSVPDTSRFPSCPPTTACRIGASVSPSLGTS